MKWEETALEVLKSKFNNGIFRAKDVFKLLNEKKDILEEQCIVFSMTFASED